MTFVTASGCEIMITWEPSISVIVAPARSAIERTTSVPAALSAVATTAHDGRCFHAGARAIPGDVKITLGSEAEVLRPPREKDVDETIVELPRMLSRPNLTP